MVRPRYVVLENVSAVLGPEFQRVADDLAALGYDIAWTCLRASDVGAPHRRERVFIVATDTTRQSGSVGLIGGPDAAVSGTGPVDLLPTPSADRYGYNQSPGPGAAVRYGLDSIDKLLPTPTSRDGKGANQRSDETCLPGALLPTPNASDCTGGKVSHPDTRRENGHSVNLSEAVLFTWGKYESAIRRWESLTRPAPAPTEPNTKGNPRLAAAFSEWMMGWPAGWATDVHGISRNDALRIIGNGVVPQQATAALRWLLNVSEAVV
jgi:DNA (cytosine-5)-methyltransferase 1